MNRRGFLRAAASVVPMAAIGAPAAEAIASIAAPASGGLGMIAGGAYLGGGGALEVAVPTAAGIFSQLAYAAFHRVEKCEEVRRQWWAAYRRHRIEVRQGKVEREPARLIWLRVQLRIARSEQTNGGGPQPPKRGSSGPRLMKSKLKGRQSEKRRINALKRMGYVTWPWGDPL